MRKSLDRCVDDVAVKQYSVLLSGQTYEHKTTKNILCMRLLVLQILVEIMLQQTFRKHIKT